jgi:segregation and condensation protein B
MANDRELHPKYLIEAMLFSVPQPLLESEIIERLPFRLDVRRLLKELQEDYRDRGFELRELSEGRWAIRTRPDHSHLARQLLAGPSRTSRAALECLYVVAYFQPVTRGEIERIRGVQSAKGTMDLLIFKGWIKPGPRRSTPGNPMTFLTTNKFLEDFNYSSVNDLPNIEQMREEGLLNREIGVDLPSRTEDMEAEGND